MSTRYSVAFAVGLFACGTETPRTFHPDAGLPAAPFDSYAKVQGADSGSSDGGSVDGGSVDGGSLDGGSSDGGSAEGGSTGGGGANTAASGATAAPSSSALTPLVAFPLVLFTSARELRLESGDSQKYAYALQLDPHALLASRADALPKGELAHWTAQAGGLEVGFRRTAANVVTAHVFVRNPAPGRLGLELRAQDFRFAVPENATLQVESRASGDGRDAGR